MMAKNDFFVISEKDKKGALRLTFATEFDNIYELFRSEYIPENRVICIRNCGNRLYDVLHTDFPGLSVVSKRVTDIISNNLITGWRWIPVWIESYNIEYYLLTVTGRCSSIDYSKSEIVIREPIVPGGRTYKSLRGIYFDLDSWDESDIFTPNNTLFTFTTEKVVKLFSKHKIDNFHFDNLHYYDWMIPLT